MLTALYPNSYHDSLVISFGNNIHNDELSQLSLASRLSNFFIHLGLSIIVYS